MNSREVPLHEGQWLALTEGDADVFVQSTQDPAPWIAVGRFTGPTVLLGATPPHGHRVFAVPTAGAVWRSIHDTDAATEPPDLDHTLDLSDPASAAVAAHESWIAAETERLAQGQEAVVASLTYATDALAKVMDQPDVAPNLPVGRMEQLDEAIRRIGDGIGVAFPPINPGTVYHDPVVEIANSGGCRVRPVSLAGQWWTHAIEPVLAYRGPDMTPVACLTAEVGQAKAFDPVVGRWLPLADIAHELAAEGYAFTRPLPPERTSARDLLAFAFGRSKGTTRQLLIAGLLAGLAGLAIPLITTLFFDLVIPQQSVTLLLGLLVLLVGAALAVGLLQLTQNIALLRLEGVLQQELEPSIWNHLLRLPSGFFRGFTTGDLVNRVQGIDTIRQLIGGSVLTSFITAVFATVNLVILFIYSVPLALITLLVVVAVVGLILVMNIRNIRNQRAGFRTNGLLYGYVFQLLGGVSKIRVAGAESALVQRWEQLFRENMKGVHHRDHRRIRHSHHHRRCHVRRSADAGATE